MEISEMSLKCVLTTQKHGTEHGCASASHLESHLLAGLTPIARCVFGKKNVSFLFKEINHRSWGMHLLLLMVSSFFLLFEEQKRENKSKLPHSYNKNELI